MRKFGNIKFHYLKLKDKMEKALKLSVPVAVDLKVGLNWGEMKDLKV